MVCKGAQNTFISPFSPSVASADRTKCGTTEPDNKLLYSGAGSNR